MDNYADALHLIVSSYMMWLYSMRRELNGPQELRHKVLVLVVDLHVLAVLVYGACSVMLAMTV